ncbi:MAG: hypothetical protein HZC52_08800 [Planctomycetes bacterium]|nr:hypothetical protein [Planctomycetota bacterium]
MHLATKSIYKTLKRQFEKSKSGMQDSYKKLEELSNHWILQQNKDLLKEIGGSLNKFYTSANQVIEKRRSPENDVTAHYFATNMTPLFKVINEKIDKIMEELSNSPGTNEVRDAIYASAQYRAGTARWGMAIRGFMESADEKFVKDFEAAQGMRNGGLTKLKSLSSGLSVGLQEIVKGIVKEEESFISHAEKIFAIRRGNDYRLDLKHLREELAPLVAAVQKNIDQIGVNMSGLLEGETQRTLGLQRSMWLIALISVSVSVSVGAFVTVLLPLKITTLFRNMVTELIYGASNVASASEQISESSQSLSEGASEQAASIQETSATMEEITSMTKQNADNAQEASKLATACNLSVEHGNTTVVEMNNAMKNIHESSGKIADIIKIIEGIAFQTNLLALNAAVEAARAGEHGRGFAVVAEEVRNLAQRSSTASKDITTLITDSVHKATTGMELVKKTEDVFTGVVAQVKKVTDLVNEISTASDEQNNGIQQINKAIQQMDQVVQNNAASAEETAASSEELTAQAQALNDLVNKVGLEVGMENKASGAAVQSTVSKKKRPLPVITGPAAGIESEGKKTKLVTADYV